MGVTVMDNDCVGLVGEVGGPEGGDYGNAKVRFYAGSGGAGVAGVLCSLEAGQLAREGERFGGGGNALEGFDDISSETAADVEEEAEEFLA